MTIICHETPVWLTWLSVTFYIKATESRTLMQNTTGCHGDLNTCIFNIDFQVTSVSRTDFSFKNTVFPSERTNDDQHADLPCSREQDLNLSISDGRGGNHNFYNCR